MRQMEKTMELDELKSAWQLLDRRLEQHAAINLHILKESQLDRLRSRLRPLAWGQIVQIAAGLFMALWAAAFWSQHRDVAHLLIAGLIVHAAGLSMILLGAVVLVSISRIDYSAPVLAIQRQLAQLRVIYVRGGFVVGMSWSILWIPFVALIFQSAFGIDLYANAPSVAYIGVAVGIALMFGVWLLHRWSARHPELQRTLDDAAAGASLVRARRILDEIARFEQS